MKLEKMKVFCFLSLGCLIYLELENISSVVGVVSVSTDASGSSGLGVDESVVEIILVEHGGISTLGGLVFVVSVPEESGDTEAANDSNNDTNDHAGVR